MLAGRLPGAKDSKLGEQDDCKDDGLRGETAKELLFALLKDAGLARPSAQEQFA